MKVLLTPEEYRDLCVVADFYGTTPAALAHKWIIEQTHLCLLLLERRMEGSNADGRESTPSASSDPSRPSIE